MKNSKSIKAQQRLKSEGNNVFTKEINKIALISNDDKRKQSINVIERCIWNEQRSSKQKRRDGM